MNWTNEIVTTDDCTIFRSAQEVKSELPRILREFEDETDCLMEDLDRRYLDTLKGACDGYKHNVEMMAEALQNDPDFKVMYQHKLTK